MGAAEDAYRRRQDAAEVAKARRVREYQTARVRDMQKYLPRAVVNLRRLDYPTSGLGVKKIMWNHEERLAWELVSRVIGHDYGDCVTVDRPGVLLLSDGTIIIEEVNGNLKQSHDWIEILRCDHGLRNSCAIVYQLRRLASLEVSKWGQLMFAFIRPQLKP